MATFEGTSGHDELWGGNEDDILIGHGGDDLLDGGPGNDLAVFSGNFSDYAISYDSASHQYTLVDQVAGRDGTDVVQGVEYFAFLDGMHTLGELVPGAGDGQVLNGTPDYDNLVGGAGFDTIYGFDGGDQLRGMGGDDVLDGGAGWDMLEGGPGRDVFVFANDPANGADYIADFVAGEDHIRLDHQVFTALTPGPLAPESFQAGPATQAWSADVRIVYDTDGGGLYYDPDGAGGMAPILFAQLYPPSIVGVLSTESFVVV